MQDKIIAAIEKALMENLNHAYICYEINLQEIAAEIAAAIAPLLEAGEVDWKPKIDDDILVDGKRQAIYRGSAAGLAIVVFKSGMQLTVPFDRISKC